MIRNPKAVRAFCLTSATETIYFQTVRKHAVEQKIRGRRTRTRPVAMPNARSRNPNLDPCSPRRLVACAARTPRDASARAGADKPRAGAPNLTPPTETIRRTETLKVDETLITGPWPRLLCDWLPLATAMIISHQLTSHCHTSRSSCSTTPHSSSLRASLLRQPQQKFKTKLGATTTSTRRRRGLPAQCIAALAPRRSDALQRRS